MARVILVPVLGDAEPVRGGAASVRGKAEAVRDRVAPVLSPFHLRARAMLAFCVSLTVFLVLQQQLDRGGTPGLAYFHVLADAFLHGRLYLADPSNVYDLTEHEGRWYVPFPPLPAAMLMPWVAWRGADSIHVPVFFAVVAAAGVAGVLLLLDTLLIRGWTRVRPRDNLWLAGLFAFGTVYLCATVESTVWFISHVCTVAVAAWAALLAAAHPSPWRCGGLLAIALWGRPTVLFMWPLLAGLSAMQRSGPWRAWLPGWALRSAIPLLVSIGGLAWYNAARFGDPLDFGYARQNVGTEVRTDLLAWGQFHPRFVLRNVYAMFLAPPAWPRDWSLPRPDEWGMSLFLTTPALLCLWNARARGAPGGPAMVRGAWLATGLLLVPLLLYYNTGYSQFGSRFSLDFQVPLFVLLSVAVGARVNLWMKLLICASVLINVYGTWWFLLKPYWKAMSVH